ncbi:MAG: ABC transporter ATP-binding protein [Methylotenera sp.]|nr:ABC transporter ATP-binding protein [Oligoflexia bacterium]
MAATLSPGPAKARINLLKTVVLDRWTARAFILLTSLLGATFGLLSPYFQKVFVDRILGHPVLHLELFPGLPPLALITGAFVTLMISQAFSFTALYLGTRESILMQKKLGDQLYQHALSLRVDQLAGRTTGEIISIYATDVPGATTLLDQTLPTGAAILFPLILAPIALQLLYDIPAWSTLIFTLVVIGINTLLSKKQARYFFTFKQLAAERTGLVSEWIQNMRTLRILGWIEAFETIIRTKRVEETENRVAMVTNGQVMSSIASTVTFFMNLAAIATLVAWRKQAISPGDLLALLWILGVFLSRPFRQLPWFFTWALDSLSSMRRLQAFMDLGQPALQDPETVSGRPDPQDASVQVERLSLKIGEATLLRDISFEIASGEFVAIVGEVGSGKSLLLLSLLKETGASFSKYRVGGQSEPQFRSQFAFVPQEGFVMSASLFENVAFDYAPSPRDRLRAQSALNAAEFREHDLNAEIGERGVNLSGGQRQRVGLARATFFDRPIILMDDCLSALDVDTERKLIQHLFFGEWKKKTRILVTHRLNVLSQVDRVLFLQDGMLAACGSYEELMENSTAFKKFVSSVSHEKETLHG